jgi:hypothetical protein
MINKVIEIVIGLILVFTATFITASVASILVIILNPIDHNEDEIDG